jgi:hypothetical protein
MGFEQIGLAGGRRAAAHVDSRDGRLREHHGGDARGEPRIIGLTDQDAGDVGDQISMRQGSPRRECLGLASRRAPRRHRAAPQPACFSRMKMDDRKRSRNFTS